MNYNNILKARLAGMFCDFIKICPDIETFEDFVQDRIEWIESAVNEKGDGGYYPLDIICLHKDHDLAERMFDVISEYIDDFETESGHYGTTPLYYAVCAGNVDLVKTLVREFRAHIRHSDELGRNALNTAKNLAVEHDSPDRKEIYEFLCRNVDEDN